MFAVASPACAGESYDVKDGFYIGGSWVQNNMSGEFDDTFFLIDPPNPDIYDVPDVDDGMGFGVFVGWRVMKGALEIGYQRSTHDTSTSLAGMPDSEAAYNVVDLNLKVDVFEKFDLFAQHRLRPYVLVGFGIPWLTIEDGSTDGVSLHDETFVGYALNAGAGIAYYFDPQWALTGGVIHRWNWFRSVESIKTNGSLEERTLNFTVGIAYTF
jgi:opacity protein-like surface antigen